MADLLGSRVIVPGSTRGSGILRYIGPIQEKSGVFAGIELQGPIAASRGKNNGSVDGVQYFEVQQPMSGLFIPWERLRSANPRLPRVEGSGTPLSGSSDDFRTPSPRQKSPSRASRPSSLSQSPQLTQTITVAKRRTVSGESNRSNGATRSIGGSRSDLGDLFNRTRSQYDGESARREINELKAVIITKTNELQERDRILSDLQSTISELQSVLREMEEELERKDQKIAQQKADNESAREEWRESLQLMLSAQLETEELYERHLLELEKEKGDENSRIAELERSIEALKKDNELLKQQLDLATEGSPTDDKRQELETSLDRLQQDVSSLEAVIQDSQERVRSRDVQILELEAEIEVLRLKEIEGLLQQVGGISISELEAAKRDEELKELQEKLNKGDEKNSKLEDQVKSLRLELSNIKRDLANSKASQDKGTDLKSGISEDVQKQIEDLTHELKMRPTFEELTELQASLDEVELLHQKSLEERNNKMNSIEQENKRLNDELEKVRQELKASKTPVAPLQEHTSDDRENRRPTSFLENNTLGIYKPPEPVDPSRGKQNWCGLCERDGHSSLNCPYENDIF